MALYEKGAARRKLLLDVTLSLLADQPLESISLHTIAKAANVPSGSAYHFFGGAQEVFIALAERFARELTETIIAPYPSEETSSWQQLYSAAVDRAVIIYNNTPAYCPLILGPYSPPALKLSDRENDAALGVLFIQVMDQYFELPSIPDFSEKVFYSIEIVDLFLSLSFIYHQELLPDMIAEGKLAALSYLEKYLPNSLPSRTSKSE